ncbi:MAG: InlB B-repeat-containing protein, partial [Treponema sp.]|nr:InlB B-repeat-containing protein [Treponema sp.]
MKCNGFMKPALAPASALALVCALALAALLGCKNPASGGNETETPRDVQFTITFDSAGGTEVPPLTGDEGSKIDKPEDPAREGYAFLGWFTEPEGGALFTAWPYTLAGDLTLYARWHNDAYGQILEYTITFNAGGGTEVSVIKVYEGTPVGKPVDPVKDGYAFQGWFDAESGGTKYEWPHTLAGDLIVYAQWLALNRYTITFDSAGGTEVPQVTDYEGATVDKPVDPNRDEYIFLGWFDAALGGTKYEWPLEVSGDLTLYAQWTGISYTVEYDANGGTGSTAATSHVYGTESPLAENGFSREGYNFEGWNTQTGGQGLNYSAGQFVKNLAKEDGAAVKLYARWTDIVKPVYTISFNSNKGSQVEAIKDNVGAFAGAPVDPILRGYIFQGWYGAAEGGTKYDWPLEVSGDLTLYAQWTLASYTITYNLNGGSNVGGNPVAYTYTIESNGIILASPAKSGAVFGGWYENEKFSGSAVTSIPKGSVGDKTFWAKWTPITYAVSYNLNGGSNAAGNPAAYTIESKAITLAAPSRAGYDFGGWYANADFSGGAVDVIYAGSTGDKTFWAKWEPVSYAISYNLNGGSNAAGNPAAYTIET